MDFCVCPVFFTKRCVASLALCVGRAFFVLRRLHGLVILACAVTLILTDDDGDGDGDGDGDNDGDGDGDGDDNENDMTRI